MKRTYEGQEQFYYRMNWEYEGVLEITQHKKCEVVDVISRNNSNALSFFLSFP